MCAALRDVAARSSGAVLPVLMNSPGRLRLDAASPRRVKARPVTICRGTPGVETTAHGGGGAAAKTLAGAAVRGVQLAVARRRCIRLHGPRLRAGYATNDKLLA